MKGLTIKLCDHRAPARRGQPHAVTSFLRDAGHHVTLIEDGTLDQSSDGVVWIQGNVNWFRRILGQLAARSEHERPFVVLWHFEPLPPPRVAGLHWPRLNWREIAKILLFHWSANDVYTNYFRLRRLAQKGLPDLLVVSTPSRREFLAERGMSAHFVPLGYDPSHGHDMGLPRDIDVVFLGALEVPRRKRLLKRLRRSGVNLLAIGSWTDPAYWGENRTLLLNRTKIYLNVQRFSGEFSGLRLILGMANKTLVISEPMYNPAPFVPGTHYVSATIEEIPKAISYYLAHHEERERIVNEGYRFVTQELTMGRSLAQILDLIREQVSR